MLLILDQAANEVHHLGGFEVFGCVDLVVGDECHAAGDQLLLECHHLEQSLRTAQAVALEDVDVRHACVGDGLFEKHTEARTGQVAATDCIIQKDVVLAVQSFPLHLLDVRIRTAEGYSDGF